MPNNIILTLFSIFLLNLTSSFSQKEDYIWLLGYSEEIEPPDSSHGGINFDFNKIPMEVKYIKRKNDFWHTNASICDNNGELLCFTNGIYIGNRNFDVMDNGLGINEWDNYGYGIEQGALILPFPCQNEQYYALQGTYNLINFGSRPNYVMTSLHHALIDMNTNDSIGTVKYKKSILYDEYMNFGMMTACLNGNGRDWWIPIVKRSSDTILMFKLDKIGINLVEEFIVDRSLRDGVGSVKFTPDGTKYINARTAGTIYVGFNVDIFDFDRCTGELSNHVFFTDDPVIDTSFSVSIAISSNSRYLYVSNTWHIFQYDLEAEDIQGSRITILKWDGFFDLNPTAFDKMQMAPDGKIYVSAPGSSHYFHVIHAPDSVGVDCRAEQRAIKLPAWNNSTIPNFPHFRMGKMKGSPCDSITASVDLGEEKTIVQASVHPNPSIGLFNVTIEGSDILDWRYELADIYGHFIKEKSGSLHSNEIAVDLFGYPQGVYFLKLIDQNDRIVEVKRLIVQ